MTYTPTYTASPPEDGLAVLYVHDGGSVECGQGQYRTGHSITLHSAATARPRAKQLRTERGTWERIDAAFLTAYGAAYGPEALAGLRCESCGARPGVPPA